MPSLPLSDAAAASWLSRSVAPPGLITRSRDLYRAILSRSKRDSGASDGATRQSPGGGCTDTNTDELHEPDDGDHDEPEPDEARKDVYLQVLAVEPPDAVGAGRVSRYMHTGAVGASDGEIYESMGMKAAREADECVVLVSGILHQAAPRGTSKHVPTGDYESVKGTDLALRFIREAAPFIEWRDADHWKRKADSSLGIALEADRISREDGYERAQATRVSNGPMQGSTGAESDAVDATTQHNSGKQADQHQAEVMGSAAAPHWSDEAIARHALLWKVAASRDEEEAADEAAAEAAARAVERAERAAALLSTAAAATASAARTGYAAASSAVKTSAPHAKRIAEGLGGVLSSAGTAWSSASSAVSASRRERQDRGRESEPKEGADEGGGRDDPDGSAKSGARGQAVEDSEQSSPSRSGVSAWGDSWFGGRQ